MRNAKKNQEASEWFCQYTKNIENYLLRSPKLKLIEKE